MKQLTQKTLEKLQKSYCYEDLTAINWRDKRICHMYEIDSIKQDSIIYLDSIWRNIIIKGTTDTYNSILHKLLK